MIGQRQLIMLGVTVTLLGVSFAYGYHKGTVTQIRKAEKVRVKLQEDLLDLNDLLNVKNVKILQLNREKEGLINDLENQAITAKGSSASGVSTTGGLRRLERRWSSSPTSP